MKKLTELDRIKKNVKRSVYEELIIAIRTKIGRRTWDDCLESAMIREADDEALAVPDGLKLEIMRRVTERNNLNKLNQSYQAETAMYAMRVFEELIWNDFRHLCLDYYDINTRYDIYEFMYRQVEEFKKYEPRNVELTRKNDRFAKEMSEKLIRITKLEFSHDLLMDSARFDPLNLYIKSLAEDEFPLPGKLEEDWGNPEWREKYAN